MLGSFNTPKTLKSEFENSFKHEKSFLKIALVLFRVPRYKNMIKSN